MPAQLSQQGAPGKQQAWHAIGLQQLQRLQAQDVLPPAGQHLQAGGRRDDRG